MKMRRFMWRAGVTGAGAAAVLISLAAGSESPATAKGGDRPTVCLGREITLYGTAGNDFDEGSIVGTPNADVIYGGRGKDYIEGRGGADVICGALGSDLIIGGSGRDLISGGTQADVIAGENGNDKLFAGPGADQMDGQKGFDRCQGGPGDDVANQRGCEKASSTTFVLRQTPPA